MSRMRLAALAGVLLVALAPSAAAYSMPVTYYLKNAVSPAGIKTPVGDGDLSTIVPATLYTDPENATKNEIGTRMVFPAIDAALPTQFVTTNTTYNQPRIYGSVIVFVFAPKTPLIQNANMSMQLVYLPPGAGPTDAGEVIATASVAVDGGNQSLPDPQSFVPPDPTDPEAALAYIQGQALVYGLTKLREAGIVAFLDDATKDGYIDYTLPDAEGKLAFRLVLEPGSSPLPVPVGAGQPIVYDNFVTPSLVYVPWYAADVVPPTPPPTPPQPTPPPSTSPSSSSDTSDDSSSSSGSKKSPGVEPIALILGLAGLAALAARRRT